MPRGTGFQWDGGLRPYHCITLFMKTTLSIPLRSIRTLRQKSIKSPVMTHASSLVSPEFVAHRLHEPDFKVIDSSWFMPTSGRKAADEFKAERIRNSLFLDVDGIGDSSSGLPHMLPTSAGFQAALNTLGISPSDTVCFYDRLGIFSSPRAWFTFNACGFKGPLFIMEGGLPAWKLLKLPLETNPVDDEKLLAASRAAQSAAESAPSLYIKDHGKVRTLAQMVANIKSNAEVVIDARPAGRFFGKDPEPRAELRGGHIPGSKSIPFSSILNTSSTPGQTKLKSIEEIKGVFNDAGVDLDKDNEIVATCGSGMTACILALGVFEVTGKLISLYDGSWTEYGAQSDTPISTHDE